MVTYVGAAQGGVWKTTDAGDHWAPVFDDAIGAGGTGLAIGSLAVDPADSNTVYAGTGEANLSIDSYFGGGIFKSTNAGGAWAKLGGALFDTCYVADLEIRGGVVLASAVRVGRWIRSCVGGVYRSTDGGATWTRTLTDDSDTWSPQIWPNGDPRIRTTGAFDVAPGGAGTWFATVHGDDPDHAGGNIFRSTNDGAPGRGSRAACRRRETGARRSQAPRPIGIASMPSLSSTQDADYGGLLGIYTSADGGTPGRSSRRRSPSRISAGMAAAVSAFATSGSRSQSTHRMPARSISALSRRTGRRTTDRRGRGTTGDTPTTTRLHPTRPGTLGSATTAACFDAPPTARSRT